MNEKDHEQHHEQHSQINEKGFKIHSKRNYIGEDRYLIFLIKEKDDTPPEEGSFCPIKSK